MVNPFKKLATDMRGHDFRPRLAALTGFVVIAIFAVSCARFEGTSEDLSETGMEKAGVGISQGELVSPLSSKFPVNPLKEEEGYRIVRVKVTAVDVDRVKRVHGEVVLDTPAGTEQIELGGDIQKNARGDYYSDLTDRNPQIANQQRMAGAAYCFDGEACTQIVLRLSYMVGDKEIRKQYVSPSLAGSGASDNSTQKQTVEDEHEHEHEHEDEGAVPSDSAGEDAGTDRVFDEEQKKEREEFEGTEQMGNYVGVRPSPQMIRELLKHPPASMEVPAPPAADSSKMKDGQSPDSSKKPEPGMSDQKDSDKSSEQGKEKDSGKGKDVSWFERAQQFVLGQLVSDQTRVPSTEASEQALTPEVYERQLAELEKHLAPLMNIREGGRARNYHMTVWEKRKRINGILENGTTYCANNGFEKNKDECSAQLPFKFSNTGHHGPFGTGMMMSLLQNGIRYFLKSWYPGVDIYIGQVSRKRGGPFRGHGSHQNGLDVDIAYVGQTGFQSILTRRRVIDGFDYTKTWQLLRLFHSQKVIGEDGPVSVVTRVFMTKEIKRGFCSWANSHKLMDNADDADLMRRIRHEASHYHHVHVRLRCSPYYPACRDQRDVDSKDPTGCEGVRPLTKTVAKST